MSEKNLYVSYIVIGIAYVVFKIGFVMAGYLHLGAISHGLVPAVLTTAAGLWGLRNMTNPEQKSWLHWTLIILPVLVLITTPPFMYWKQGSELWLTNGRFPILVLYEIMALGQIGIALSIRRHKAQVQIS
ncbi:MAG: hypothetical protein CSB13_10635 [Chloroflexi bacterium]|nr:MAG: hypothetical protein CSB13_10635 [Chloroflexota bacterium]